MPVIIPGATAAVGGLISGITGIFQKHKANKLLKNLKFPTEEMPSEILQNQSMAREMSNQGLPSEQYNKAMRDIQRQQMTALKSANDRRGGLASISSIQQGTNDATTNLNSLDAQQRIANKKYLIGVNNNVAGWKDKLFQTNVKDKYNRDYGYAMSLLGSGNQNFTNGLDSLVAGAGMAGSAYSNKNNPYYNSGGY